MITDAKLGLKIAQDETEVLWTRFKDVRTQTIKDLEERLVIEKELLKLAKSKLSKYKK